MLHESSGGVVKGILPLIPPIGACEACNKLHGCVLRSLPKKTFNYS